MATEVEKRDSGAAIVKPVPMPRELQELGLRIGEEPGGLRVVYVPEELRKRVNVVNPVTSYVQADPNWSPGVSVVKLDVERDTYNVNGKRGLNKQALETIGKAAGVLYTRTARVPRDELQEGELWAYRATVGFRRSDGTIDEVTRERGFNAEAERGEIEDAVTKSRSSGNDESSAPKYGDPHSERWAEEVRKRWLNELRFGPAKTESKAINRALRAGLAIPTSLKREDAVKPFLVIGYNFTPDYDDPEIKRALIAVGLNAQAAIYGGSSGAAGELEAGTDTSGGSPADVVEAGAQAGTDPDEGETSGDDDEQAGGAGDRAPGSSADPEPDLDDGDGRGFAGGIPEAAIDEAGALPVKGDLTTADLVAKGQKGAEWLSWALANLDPEADADRLGAIRLYLEHREPDVWRELAGE